MGKTAQLKPKVIAAFKGFLINHRLELTKERTPNDPAYDVWHGLVRMSDEYFDFHFRKRDEDRLLDLIERLYPGQTYRRTVSQLLTRVTQEWMVTGGTKEDQPGLERGAERLLTLVQEHIRDFVVLVPVEGLDVSFSHDVQLARCNLCRNTSQSDLQRAVTQFRQRMQTDDESSLPAEEAPAYFKVNVQGQFRRAIERAGIEAELAMNVLRLFVSSFYFDVYQRAVPTRMGIVGTRREGRYGNMYILRKGVPVDDQTPGSHTSYQHFRSYKLDSALVAHIQAHGLDRINTHLTSIQQDGGGETARSLLRAITWFGQATAAGSIAESFLMYAISIESLLLGNDRAHKETYGRRMAALVTRANDPTIFPFGGPVSRRFASSLDAAVDAATVRAVVYERVVDLFNTRNHIAHGTKLEGEIKPLDLLDFETLVRNSILSFVDGEWSRLVDFKQWVSTITFP